MRFLPCRALAVVLAACGADPAPRPGTAPLHEQNAPPSAAPVTADPGLGPIAARMIAGTASPAECERAAQRATDLVADLLTAAAAGDAVAGGRAPAVIASLGAAALPGLCEGLAHRDVAQRRIAALTLLQWTGLREQGAATAVVAALAAARSDADPAVRAAAEHAWRRATGDTSALDQSRAQHEAAERR